MRYRYLVLAILALAVIIYVPNLTGNATQGNASHIYNASYETALVTRVIDGDTLVLENEERVRLLGMNTPERGQHLFQESTQFLRDLVENRTVTLEPYLEDKDKYGRLLRYVHLGKVFVNMELVRMGYARTYMLEPEDPHCKALMEAETRARGLGLGIWPMDPEDFCIGILYFRYDAWGNDNEDLNGEYVTLRNFCEYPKDMTGWTVKDNSGRAYKFPGFTLQNKTTVTLHTGPGEDTREDLYWGQDMAVWNNNGDTLRVWDSQGELVLEYSY